MVAHPQTQAPPQIRLTLQKFFASFFQKRSAFFFLSIRRTCPTAAITPATEGQGWRTCVSATTRRLLFLASVTNRSMERSWTR